MSYTTMNAKFNGLDDTAANKSLVVGKVDEDLSYNVLNGSVGVMTSGIIYPVLDKTGQPIAIPNGAIVENLTIKKFDSLGLSAGAGIQLGLSTRNSAGVYSAQAALGGPKTFGNVNDPVTGTTVNYMAGPVLSSADNYLTALCSTATAAATGGSGAIRVVAKVIY